MKFQSKVITTMPQLLCQNVKKIKGWRAHPVIYMLLASIFCSDASFASVRSTHSRSARVPASPGREVVDDSTSARMAHTPVPRSARAPSVPVNWKDVPESHLRLSTMPRFTDGQLRRAKEDLEAPKNSHYKFVTTPRSEMIGFLKSADDILARAAGIDEASATVAGHRELETALREELAVERVRAGEAITSIESLKSAVALLETQKGVLAQTLSVLRDEHTRVQTELMYLKAAEESRPGTAVSMEKTIDSLADDLDRHSIGTRKSRVTGKTSVSRRKVVALGPTLQDFVVGILDIANMSGTFQDRFFKGMSSFYKTKDPRRTDLGFMGEQIAVEISDLTTMTRPVITETLDKGSGFPVISNTAVKKCDEFLQVASMGLSPTEQACMKRVIASVAQHVINTGNESAKAYFYLKQDDKDALKLSTFLFVTLGSPSFVAITRFFTPSDREYAYSREMYTLVPAEDTAAADMGGTDVVDLMRKLKGVK